MIRETFCSDIRFGFDNIFDSHCSSAEVFERTTKPILDGVLDGYNATVFAYGATGAGKTHTMLGSTDEPGVMVQTVEELYRRIEAGTSEWKTEVAISYLEVRLHVRPGSEAQLSSPRT